MGTNMVAESFETELQGMVFQAEKAACVQRPS